MPIPLRRSGPPQPPGLLGSPSRNLVLGVGFLLIVMAISTACYVLAGWSLADAFYMVVMTVYTVGYGEVHAVDTTPLRTITIATIMFGCTGMIFVTGALVQFITLNQLNQMFGIKRMNTQIDKLNRHVIICGFGRTGNALAHALRDGNASFVILEQDPAAIEHAKALGYLCMEVDATDEEALQAAGVTRARVLASVLSNDAANVYITLSARSLNPSLEIIARGELPSTESKLLQAGANHVVLPTHIGAERMAEMILYRETSRFIRGSEGMRNFERTLNTFGMEIEVVATGPDSSIVGHTVEAVERRAEGAFMIIQIDRQGGGAIIHPDPSLRIEAGDGVVLVGKGLRARALSSLFSNGIE